MSSSTLTYKGADWIANAIAGNYKKPNVMYVVYSNDGTDALDIHPGITASYYSQLSGGLWYIRITGSVVSSMSSTSEEYTNNSVLFSSIARKDGVVDRQDKPELTPGMSKIISVAVGYTDNVNDPSSDIIVSVGNITKSGVASPMPWIDGMDISISCPVSITVNG